VNNGKICVSVCAENADEMIAKIKQAEEFADLVEVRFDCLAPNKIHAAISMTVHGAFKKPLVATYRDSAEGGRGSASLKDRIAFWNRILQDFGIGDLENDIASFAMQLQNCINSFHDFQGVPKNIEEIYESMSPHAGVWKIAVKVKDVCDAIPVWKMLKRARKESRQFVPIAMGEAGKWTRILGLAHGAYLTYASLDEGKETADGQISAREMIDAYRVRELDKETKVYGVIGNPVSGSLSPDMHNAAFVAAGLNAVFVPLIVKDLDAFMTRMVLPSTREVELNFAGFAVTMPHKQAAMKYIDEIDDTAAVIGAANTINIENGKLTGHNTDAEGFIESLKARSGDLNDARVAVLGAGGAARACLYALSRERTSVTVFARDEEKARSVASEFGVHSSTISNLRSKISNFGVLVNATPLGMKGPLEKDTPLTADELKGVKLVYDLVTSSEDTPLIREAKKAGIATITGVEMLIEQGAKQFEVWTDGEPPIAAMRAAVWKRMEEKG
jgi:3-dehydroquinate dehydratase/shikimate dehydrogenase